MMLHEHVFLGRAQGSRPQRVCCAEHKGSSEQQKLRGSASPTFIDSLITDVHYPYAAYVSVFVQEIKRTSAACW